MQSIIHRQPACRIEGFDKLRSMRQPLDQVTIGILEHRFTKEFATVLQRFGASVYACPMLEERPVENREELEQFVRHVAAGEFDLMILLSGVGGRFLVSAVDCTGWKNECRQALANVLTGVRGANAR